MTEKECFTCAWHDNFSWVCFNGNSEHRADFTDPEDSCPVWEGREDSDEKKKSEFGAYAIGWLYLLAPVIILAVVLVVKYFIAASDLPDWFKFALLK